jgi:LytS/YehU family sensor histidine kinase
MIAPALFLPYIENAFIHCPVNERGAMLNFGIKTGPDKTVFTAQNTKANTFPSGKDKGGIGMVLAKKRLDVLYPNRHSLHIVPAETMFIVEVIIYHNES